MFLGSGKSLVALNIADKMGFTNILITSDKNNVTTTWPAQILTHTDWEDRFQILVRPTGKQLERVAGKPTVVICNYDKLRSEWDRLRLFGFQFWIGDESSEFKDQRTRRAKDLRYITEGIGYKMILNGKAMTEDMEDLFGQYLILDGGLRLGKSITSFRMKFMQPDPSGYAWIPKRSSFSMVQKRTEDITYWQEKSEDVKMPTVQRYMVKVDMTEDQAKLSEQLGKLYAAEYQGKSIETNYAPVIFSKLTQLCGGVFRYNDIMPETEAEIETTTKWLPVTSNKFEILGRILKDNPRSKIVIWHNYIPETQLLIEYLEGDQRISLKWQMFNAMPPNDAKDQLDRFRQSKGPALLLIRNSFCRGLNQMADADIAVFWSSPFSYARRAQAEGRTHRLSSTLEETHIIDIITEGGADEVVYRMLNQKKDFSLTLPALYDILRA
jgi:hypothetical protein